MAVNLVARNTIVALLIVILAISAATFSTGCGTNQDTLTTSVTPNNAGSTDISGNGNENTATNATTPVSASSPNVQYMLSATVDPQGAGSATPEWEMYASGTEAAVNATAAPGFNFDYWSGDIQNMSASTTIVMNGNKNIVAHFKALFSLTTSVDPVGAGTISPSEGYYDSGVKVAVTAKPAFRYVFDHWSGDVENQDSQQIVTMNKNKKLVAHFHLWNIGILEGQKKNLIKVIGMGTSYINYVDVTITSNIKTEIIVNIDPGIVFESPNNNVNFVKMVNIDDTNVTLGPGESQKIRLSAASINGLNEIPSESDQMLLVDTEISGDLALLLKSEIFYKVPFRLQQYAIWVIALHPQSVNGIAIGSGENKATYKCASQEEFDQIKNMYVFAGIDPKKYCLTYIDPYK